jgi:hypothetical protein
MQTSEETKYLFIFKAVRLYDEEKMVNDKLLDKHVEDFEVVYESAFHGEKTPIYVIDNLNTDLTTYKGLDIFKEQTKEEVLELEKAKKLKILQEYKNNSTILEKELSKLDNEQMLKEKIDSIHHEKVMTIFVYRYVNYFFDFAMSLLSHVYYKQKDVVKETDENKDTLALINVFLCNCLTIEDLKSLISVALDKAINCAKLLDGSPINSDRGKQYDDFKEEIYEFVYGNTNDKFNDKFNSYEKENRVVAVNYKENIMENLTAFKTLVENPTDYLFCFHDDFKKKHNLSPDQLNRSTHIVGNFIFRKTPRFEYGKINSVTIKENKEEINCMYITYLNKYNKLQTFVYDGSMCRAVCLEQKNNCNKIFK